MITPGEQYLMLEQEKAELLAELDEAIRFKWSEWLIPIGVVAGCITIGSIFENLRWIMLAVMFGYLVVDTFFITRAFQRRRRKGIELIARYEMLNAWLRRYE